jgi:hypothetical protein
MFRPAVRASYPAHCACSCCVINSFRICVRVTQTRILYTSSVATLGVVTLWCNIYTANLVRVSNNYIITNFMELSPSWEAASCAAIQELPNIVWQPEGSLPCSQEPSTCPYPESDQSSPHHPILSILFTHLRLSLPSGLFPSGFPTSNLYAFLFSPFVLHALSVSTSIWSF